MIFSIFYHVSDSTGEAFLGAYNFPFGKVNVSKTFNNILHVHIIIQVLPQEIGIDLITSLLFYLFKACHFASWASTR